jgi:hypothetical protein
MLSHTLAPGWLARAEPDWRVTGTLHVAARLVREARDTPSRQPSSCHALVRPTRTPGRVMLARVRVTDFTCIL